MPQRKIWIDTDAGTDDAMALMMALKDPNLEIVGISTVGGNVPLDNVVQNVLFLIELCDQDISVYVGAAQPLQRKLGIAEYIHGKDGFGDIGLILKDRVPSSGSAQHALKNAIAKYGNELEIINLGPLTNMATVLKSMDREEIQIKQCYIMGGLLELPGNITPLAEFNIWADPEAADVVIRSGLPMTVSGWDTTLRSGWLSIEEWHELTRIGSDVANIIHDMQHVRMAWQMQNEDNPKLTWADPCAMAVLIDESIITDDTWVTLNVRGGEDDDPHRGYIDSNLGSSGKDIRYVKDISRERYREMIWERLSN